MEFVARSVKTISNEDHFLHRTSGTLILLQCDHAALQASSPKVVRLMEGRDARAANGHTPNQLPNEILRPGGTR